MAFEPGNKFGGRGGRKPGSGRIDKAAAWYRSKGLPYLMRVAEGKISECADDHILRTRVAEIIGDRGLGKPAQAVEVGDVDGGSIFATLAQAIAEAKKDGIIP